jgi:DNA polymerase I-like protein with 3'-5' exonuclease and polymerase domains
MAVSQDSSSRRLAGLAVAWRGDRVFYLDLAHPGARAAAAAILARPGPSKVAFDAKGLLHALAGTKAGPGGGGGAPSSCPLSTAPLAPSSLIDVRLVAWLLDPDCPAVDDGHKGGDSALDRLLDAHSGAAADAAAAVGRPATARARVAAPPNRCRLACTVAAKVWHLHQHQQAALDARPDGGALRAALAAREAAIVPILARMEVSGICVDANVLEDDWLRLKDVQARAVAWLECAAGEKVAERVRSPGALAAAIRKAKAGVDLTSPAAVSVLLFETLAIPPPPGATSGRGGLPLTNKRVLAALSHYPAVRAVRAYRVAGKRLEWVAELRDAVAAEARAGGGVLPGVARVRATTRLTATSTGRLPLEDPALQTVPRAVDFDGFAGPDGALFRCAPRRAIIALPASLLVVADYRQLELRIAAHLSKDEELVRGFAAGGDPLAAVAAAVHSIPLASVTPAQRFAAKTVAYGLMYGMGDGKLADGLDCGAADAARVRAAVVGRLGGLGAWLDKVGDSCRKNGYVETIGGRRRALDLDSGAAHAGTAASFIVQGSAADIFKGALVDLDRTLALGAPGLAPGAARLVLQVHDEVVVEVGKEWAEAAAGVVADVLARQADAWGLLVALPAKTAVVASWGGSDEGGA